MSRRWSRLTPPAMASSSVALDGGVGEQPVDERATSGRRRRRPMPTSSSTSTPRRQAGLDRVLGAAAAGRSCAACRWRRRRARRAPPATAPPPRRRRRRRRAVVEAAADPVAQLGRRLLGERDGGDARRARPCRVATSWTMRSTRARVLPDPAPPARTGSRRAPADAVAGRLVGRSRRSVMRGAGSSQWRVMTRPPPRARPARRRARTRRVVALALPGPCAARRRRGRRGRTTGTRPHGRERLDRVGGERAALDAVDDRAERRR